MEENNKKIEKIKENIEEKFKKYSVYVLTLVGTVDLVDFISAKYWNNHIIASYIATVYSATTLIVVSALIILFANTLVSDIKKIRCYKNTL